MSQLTPAPCDSSSLRARLHILSESAGQHVLRGHLHRRYQRRRVLYHIQCQLKHQHEVRFPDAKELWDWALISAGLSLFLTCSVKLSIANSNNPSNQPIALHLLCLTFWLVWLCRALHPFITFVTRNLQC